MQHQQRKIGRPKGSWDKKQRLKRTDQLAKTTLNISIISRTDNKNDTHTASANIFMPDSDVNLQSTVPFQPSMSAPRAPLPWPDAPNGGDTRPYELPDADHHPFVAALDWAAPVGCSLGPFRFD